MTNMKMILLCTHVNFRKWAINPRIYTLAALIIAFLAYHSYGLSQFALEKGTGITPWVFPHLTTPPVLQVFACFTLLLFCDAPFSDKHMPFLLIRTGKRNWVIGQLLYIVLASFVYSFFILIVSALVLIPNLHFSLDWGILIKSLAADSINLPNTVTIFMNNEIIGLFSPFMATIISFSLFWLVSIFIGVVTFCFNIVIGKMSGLVVSGLLIGVSYFVTSLGTIIFGVGIYYWSPISWMNMGNVDWSYSGAFPSPAFAVIFLVIAFLLSFIISVIVFCKKDLEIQEWGY